jgi:hypothetical protein
VKWSIGLLPELGCRSPFRPSYTLAAVYTRADAAAYMGTVHVRLWSLNGRSWLYEL